MVIAIAVPSVAAAADLIHHDLFPDELPDEDTLNLHVKEFIEAFFNAFVTAELLPGECKALKEYRNICNLVSESIQFILNRYCLPFIRRIELCDTDGTLLVYH